jgi:phage portal protein BeeE
MAYTLLDKMSESGKYNSAETLDTALAIKTACTSAWFYSGNKLIGDRIAAMDARPIIKRRVRDELVLAPNHAFATLLDRPNSLMTWEFIVRYTVSWLNLLGNAYIFVSTAAPGEGVPEELWPLPANAVTPDNHTSRREYHSRSYGESVRLLGWAVPA